MLVKTSYATELVKFNLFSGYNTYFNKIRKDKTK